MGKIIAVVNQKGGVGKTTSAVNLTAALHELGQKVLLCDFDPQANATSGLGLDKRRIKYSAYDVTINDVPLKEAVVHTDYGDVLPSSSDLAGAAVELIGTEHRERQLEKALFRAKEDYDIIFIDCPPSLGLLTVNALAAADGLLIPLQCEYYALEGLSQLLATYELIHNNLNPELRIEGVLLTMCTHTNLSSQVESEAREYFGDKVFRTVISRSVKLSEAPSHGMPGVFYDKRSKGAEEYQAFAKEFLEGNC